MGCADGLANVVSTTMSVWRTWKVNSSRKKMRRRITPTTNVSAFRFISELKFVCLRALAFRRDRNVREVGCDFLLKVELENVVCVGAGLHNEPHVGRILNQRL